MKKYALLFLTFLSAVLLVPACKKSSSPKPQANNNNTTTTSPYYFKFSLNGVNYDLNANNPQYMTFYSDLAGGYQTGSSLVYPSIGLSFTWNYKDTVLESDLLGLAGKTLYFSDTAITPALTFDSSVTSNTWYSADTSNTAYYVKVTSVTFVRKDTVLTNPIRVYSITGTCAAIMQQSTNSILSNGSFSFLISRQDL